MRSVFALAAALLVLAACGGGGGGGTPASMTQQPQQQPTQPVDTDGDGVADAQDAFPNDPAETMDSDGDGVGDNADAFPNDPARAALPATIAFAPDASGHYRVDDIAAPAAADAKHMPIYGDNSRLAVGIEQDAKALRTLPIVARYGNMDIRYGRLNDGSGRATVVDYLADGSLGGPVVGQTGIRRYSTPPNVRAIGSATIEDLERMNAAVQLINAALPEGAKISVQSALSDFSLKNEFMVVPFTGDLFYSGSRKQLDNTIQIEFLPCAEYFRCGEAGASTWNNGGEAIESTYIQVNRGAPAWGDDRRATILLAHELLHALGMESLDHVDTKFDSILEYTNAIYNTSQSNPQPLSLLYPLDREGLRALYALNNGDNPLSLGPWASTASHIAGHGQHTAFGVALRNGYAEPWAYGHTPDSDLADNRDLSGSATWSGVLLGLTPDTAAVAGDAAISVNLASMTGRADFTNLETWGANTAPGAAGSGATWLDGDLGYGVAVRGNTFRETGGDDGRLTGIFTGRSHEGAAGTLERTDLTAAFGVSR